MAVLSLIASILVGIYGLRMGYLRYNVELVGGGIATNYMYVVSLLSLVSSALLLFSAISWQRKRSWMGTLWILIAIVIMIGAPTFAMAVT